MQSRKGGKFIIQCKLRDAKFNYGLPGKNAGQPGGNFLYRISQGAAPHGYNQLWESCLATVSVPGTMVSLGPKMHLIDSTE